MKMKRIEILCILIVGCCSYFAPVDCVLCYNCSGVADPASCQTTIVCGSNQSCYQQRGPSGTIDLGCSDKQHCLHPESTQNQGPVSIVGRDVPKRRHVTTRKTGSCFECCSTDNCNEQLCSSTHLSACVDDETVDCARMSTLFHICTSDYEHAAQICPQFCGLCDYADGQWSVWSSWSTCDVTCGSTTLTRTRTCTNPPPTNHGKNCIGESVEHKACALGQCPVDGGWSEWTSWDTCSVSCGVGIQHRERSCDNPTPSLFGQHCFGYNRDDKICLGPTCQHGIWSHWEPWTQCSTTCGNGIKHRFRNCAYAASCGGPAFDSDICIVKDCIQVKLAGNIVMVSINGGLWGTICDDLFDQNNNGAKVVCGMLGHNRNTAVYVDPGDQNLLNPMLLDDIRCNGTESSIMDCSYIKQAAGCSSSEIAGVICYVDNLTS